MRRIRWNFQGDRTGNRNRHLFRDVVASYHLAFLKRGVKDYCERGPPDFKVQLYLATPLQKLRLWTLFSRETEVKVRPSPLIAFRRKRIERGAADESLVLVAIEFDVVWKM